MKIYPIFLAVSLILLVQAVNATHQVEYNAPPIITTTVGELTTLQVDIKNAGPTAEYYKITITTTSPNKMEITNPTITTQILKPGQAISVFSNVRALTENSDPITVQIYRDNDLSHSISAGISVSTKKFSLPEFGLAGFLQIIAIATIVYFLFGNRVMASRR